MLRRAVEDAGFSALYVTVWEMVNWPRWLPASAGRERTFIARMTVHTGFHFKKEFGEPLWQRHGYEHVIRDDEKTSSVIRFRLKPEATELKWPIGWESCPKAEARSADRRVPEFHLWHQDRAQRLTWEASRR